MITVEIRRTEMADLENVFQVYEYARAQMKLNGNPNQWRDDRPSEAAIIGDIEKGNSYIIEQDGAICGVFSFMIGADPTYQRIEGKWLNEERYGTIHKVASSGRERGIFGHCLRYCESKISNLRIDTHRDNKIMQHMIEKSGFKKCGIIYVDDGSPRIAYQKIIFH